MPAVSKELLKQASEQYNLNIEAFQLIEDAGNPSYEVNYQGKKAILRMSSRSENMVRGELDFMRYLSNNGIRVSEVYPSKNDDIAIVSDDSERYILTLFEKLPGEHPEGDLLTEDLIRLWGRDLGKMHRLSTDYHPVDEIRRPQWHDYSIFDVVERLPESDIVIRQKSAALFSKIKSLPIDSTSYGMIHADCEPWNVLLHKDKLGWIDFDDCCYCHHMFDIAVSMTYILIASVDDALNPDNTEKNKTAQRIWSQFYAGYQEEYALSDAQRALIPDFLRFRIMQDYAHHHSVLDFDNLLDWQAYVLSYERRIILNDEDFLKVDWV